MATTAGDILTLDPMGKCSNAFFSETTNIIKAKLYMNVHWMILYKLIIFVVSEKKAFEHFPIGSNVNLCPAVVAILDAATAGHRLTLDPMGKYSNAFFSETTNMIKAKLYMNVHWMVLYKLYVFYSDMKFKMAATAGLKLVWL
jgi:hypothetical protein